jgi:hypothetical protein
MAHRILLADSEQYAIHAVEVEANRYGEIEVADVLDEDDQPLCRTVFAYEIEDAERIAAALLAAIEDAKRLRAPAPMPLFEGRVA